MSQAGALGFGSAENTYYSLTPYIVGPDIHSQYSTIGSAITAAVANGVSSSNPANIHIKPQNGGYTENPVLVDGINLIGFGLETIITGKITMTTAGTATVSGLQLQTNSDYCVSVTGSAASIIEFYNCFINITNNTAINLSSSGAGSAIEFRWCKTNTTSSGGTLFSLSGVGGINFYHCMLQNGLSIATASTASSGGLNFFHCFSNFNYTTSGTNALSAINTQFASGNNGTLTIGGSSLNTLLNCSVSGGTSSAISVGSALTASHVAVSSSNTNAITGGGTLSYAFLSFYGTSSTVNTTTLTPLATLI